MGCLMLKELVKSRFVPVISIMAGSLFLASCSSSVSRFDYPLFGLSRDDGEALSTSSLQGGARLGQTDGEPSAISGGSDLSGFLAENSAGAAPGNVAGSNVRSSYLPPQTAATEVRAARYGTLEPLSVGSDRPVTAAPDRAGYSSAGYSPMRPIREARRSFLPDEPAGYGRDIVRKTPQAVSPGRVTGRAGRLPAARLAPQSSPTRQVAGEKSGSVNLRVAAGDTLYSISRRYNVPVMKLMEINDLSDSRLTIGQRLIVPGQGSGKTVRPAKPRNRTGRSIRATSSGTYTVRSGDSFHSIAQRLGVKSSELADINGITDPGSIRAGEVLILPSGRVSRPRQIETSGKTAGKGAAGDLQVRSVKTKSIKLDAARSKSRSGQMKVAAIERKTSPSSKSKITDFRWPVRGRIIARFGPRGDGTHNDGISLAVPSGTRVRAAEDGVVAYAGNELKEYGNLILIRHSNDWVSAYAYNDKLLVKRGDKIKRGQVVARAGSTGPVEQPQVHFELRKGSKPVDPTKYMAGT